MPNTFDEATIARELKWASEVGFNTVRTNLHFLVWENDRGGLIERFRWFIEVAHGFGIQTVPVFFDDCGFGGFEPTYGAQPQPIPGLHNSRAVASPGRAAIMDRRNWPEYKNYFQDLIGGFAAHPAILFWDLYNEPGQLAVFSKPASVQQFTSAMVSFSRDLMIESFAWARETETSHPLTVGVWGTPQAGHLDKPFDTEIDRLALQLSDIVTFHAYANREQVVSYIDWLTQFGRPIINTEWMARTVDSKISDQLPLYHQRKVGCFNWGLVQGKSQTHLPWPQLVKDPDQVTTEWFHDLFRQDGTPFDSSEIELISALTSRMTGEY